MIAHDAPISGIATGPDGYVATAGYDNRLILWQRGRAIARGWHDHLVNQCAFDGTGTALVSASSDYTARVWRVPELRLDSVLGDHEDDVEMAMFDPSNTRIATASRDHHLRVFARDGTLLQRLAGHDAAVFSVAWASDDVLVSSSDDGTIRRWEVATGRLLSTSSFGAETDTLVVGRDGTLFAGNDRGEIISLHADGERRLHAHAAGIKRLALDRAGSRLVSSSYDRTLRIWRITPAGLEPVGAAAIPPIAWARGVAIDDAGRIVMGTFGTAYATYDPAREAWDLGAVADTPGLNAVHVSGGAVFAVGDAGRFLRDGVEIARLGSCCNFVTTWRGRQLGGGQLGALFDCARGAVVYQHTSPLNCAAVLADGDLLIGTYTGEGLRLTEIDGAIVAREPLRLHDQAVKGVAVRGDTIFSVSAAGDAAIHTPAGARHIARGHDKIANGVCGLADGRFATVSRDLKLRLWTGDRADVIATPHRHSIKCVAATADHVATGSYDGTVAFYDLRTGTWSELFRPTCAGISASCTAAEPGAILASSYDGCVYRIDAAGAISTLFRRAAP